MKALAGIVLVFSLFSFSLGASAQAAGQRTRAEVRAELAQYEQAGYNPADWMHFSENLQGARAKIEASGKGAQTRNERFDLTRAPIR
ncbi:DUF4148 domain-containing protein [Paraburkholderia hospita]|uniref:DUF4148 domain-containing protein n=1 Tax=Paraburkholderia hospita TaxID=169430 RepID=UPI0006848F50|nr:DUF4148 domain-containing protein [Paraburkholderia hospita]OUL73952.1 hypothetical protein CA602_40255 [Paraburkholderia hospita]SEI15511.1 protein of unknown function [Paraburkholderia hospita]